MPACLCTIPPCGNPSYIPVPCACTCTHVCAHAHLATGEAHPESWLRITTTVAYREALETPQTFSDIAVRLRPSSFYLFPQGWQILPLNGAAMEQRAWGGKELSKSWDDGLRQSRIRLPFSIVYVHTRHGIYACVLYIHTHTQETVRWLTNRGVFWILKSLAISVRGPDPPSS